MQIYCVKCRAKREVEQTEEIVFANKYGKNKRKAVKGVCPICGTKVFKVISKAQSGISRLLVK